MLGALTRHVEVTVIPTVGVPKIINPQVSALTQPQIYAKFQFQKQKALDEHIGAFIELYNLDDSSIGIIDFKKDLRGINFGALIILRIGYLETGVFQAFSGVISEATTVKNHPDFVTRISLRSGYYLIKNRTVRLNVAKFQTQASAIIQAVSQVGGTFTIGAQEYLNKKLGNAKFDENEVFNEPLQIFLKRFEQDLSGRVKFSWDDAGINPLPLGVVNPTSVVKTINIATGLIGTPEITPFGVDFKVKLDGTLRVNDLVFLQSEALLRLAVSGGVAGNSRLGNLVITSIEQVGDNRTGEFVSNIKTRFLNDVAESLLVS